MHVTHLINLLMLPGKVNLLRIRFSCKYEIHLDVQEWFEAALFHHFVSFILINANPIDQYQQALHNDALLAACNR